MAVPAYKLRQRRTAIYCPSPLVILAPGRSPPPSVNITGHSTIMGVFAMVTSPAAAASVMSLWEVSYAPLASKIPSDQTDFP